MRIRTRNEQPPRPMGFIALVLCLEAGLIVGGTLGFILNSLFFPHR